jgi:hypothetical protein
VSLHSFPPCHLTSYTLHIDSDDITKLQTVLGQFTFEQAAVLPPPLAQICEAENARLMRENHDLHCMLSATTTGPGPRRQPIPFDVVPRTRNCDDASTDREYKRRKIDTNGNGEEVYIVRLCSLSISTLLKAKRENTQSRPGSLHDALAHPPPLTVSDSPLHPIRITTTPSLC